MNAEQIRTMEAGREMDALVMEVVMGWEREAREFLPAHHWAWIKDGEKPTYLLPQFTRDIAAAWEVVENLHDSGRWVHVRSSMDQRLKVRGWACEMGKWWNRTGLGEWAETAPLAICRAALLAVMGDES